MKILTLHGNRKHERETHTHYRSRFCVRARVTSDETHTSLLTVGQALRCVPLLEPLRTVSPLMSPPYHSKWYADETVLPPNTIMPSSMLTTNHGTVRIVDYAWPKPSEVGQIDIPISKWYEQNKTTNPTEHENRNRKQ